MGQQRSNGIRGAATRRHEVAVVVAIAIVAVVLSGLSIQQYRRFQCRRFDLGNMVQAVDSTAHGHFLQVTDVNGRQVSRLGAHVDPILAAFALPWLLWPSPVMLLVAQAVFVCLAAWPAYRLGLRLLGDSRAAMLGAVALLLYPPLQYAVLNEFHPVTLAIPLLLYAFLYLEEERALVALPFLVLAALCKEEVPLVIAFMGLYFAVRKRSWWPLLITLAAALYFGVAVGLVLPHFRAGGSVFVARYGAFGSGAGQIARNVVLEPGKTIRALATTLNARYLWQLLWPFALTSVLSPLTMLVALPELLLNGLSSTRDQHLITFHYVAAEVPFIFIAALLGVARLTRWLGLARLGPARRTLGILVGVLVCVTLAGNYILGPIPFGLPGAKAAPHRYVVTRHEAVLGRAMSLVPPGAIVSAENDVGAHLSARPVIYTIPYVGDARYVVVDNARAWYFDQRTPAGLKLRRAVVGALARNPRYTRLFSEDGVIVYRRVP